MTAFRCGDVLRDDNGRTFAVMEISPDSQLATIRCLNDKSDDGEDRIVRGERPLWSATAKLSAEIYIGNVELAFEDSVERLAKQPGWNEADARQHYIDFPERLFTDRFQFDPMLCFGANENGEHAPLLTFTSGLTAEDLLPAPERRKSFTPSQWPRREGSGLRVTVTGGGKLPKDPYNYPWQIFTLSGDRIGGYSDRSSAIRNLLTDDRFFIHSKTMIRAGTVIVVDPDTHIGTLLGDGVKLNRVQLQQRAATGSNKAIIYQPDGTGNGYHYYKPTMDQAVQWILDTHPYDDPPWFAVDCSTEVPLNTWVEVDPNTHIGTVVVEKAKTDPILVKLKDTAGAGLQKACVFYASGKWADYRSTLASAVEWILATDPTMFAIECNPAVPAGTWIEVNPETHIGVPVGKDKPTVTSPGTVDVTITDLSHLSNWNTIGHWKYLHFDYNGVLICGRGSSFHGLGEFTFGLFCEDHTTLEVGMTIRVYQNTHTGELVEPEKSNDTIVTITDVSKPLTWFKESPKKSAEYPEIRINRHGKIVNAHMKGNGKSYDHDEFVVYVEGGALALKLGMQVKVDWSTKTGVLIDTKDDSIITITAIDEVTGWGLSVEKLKEYPHVIVDAQGRVVNAYREMSDPPPNKNRIRLFLKEGASILKVGMQVKVDEETHTGTLIDPAVGEADEKPDVVVISDISKIAAWNLAETDQPRSVGFTKAGELLNGWKSPPNKKDLFEADFVVWFEGGYDTVELGMEIAVDWTTKTGTVLVPEAA